MSIINTLMLYCTCPDKRVAQTIVSNLLEKRLIACANILPKVESHYVWQGKIENANETLVLIKTSQEKYKEVEKAILVLHPYELPEIIAVPIETGLPDYLQWISESIS